VLTDGIGTGKWSVLILVFALFVLAFAFQGSRGVWEPDEGVYASTALSMFETGDLLIPRLNDNPFLQKPPLAYW